MGMGAGFADGEADGDGVAFALQNELERAADVVFVVDDQDSFAPFCSVYFKAA